MRQHATLRQDLIDLSHELGAEARGLSILGEGNTSVDCGDGTFWVKSSGSSLATLGESGVSRVHAQPILDLLEHADVTEQRIEDELLAARADERHKKPSVETFLHALCLTEGAARWVGHTHPTSVNQILASRLGAEPFMQHVFPDAIVVCGAVPAVVPYVDPGLALGRAVRLELKRYRGEHGMSPKVLLKLNHGVTALGDSAREVLNIMLMIDKWARILHGTYALGGPRFLPASEVERIDRRLDEQHRRRELVGEPGKGTR